jgi:hypothetical protein
MLNRISRPVLLILASAALAVALVKPSAAQDANGGADVARTEQCGEYYGCIDYGPWPPRRPNDAEHASEAQPGPADPAASESREMAGQSAAVAQPGPINRLVQGS